MAITEAPVRTAWRERATAAKPAVVSRSYSFDVGCCCSCWCGWTFATTTHSCIRRRQVFHCFDYDIESIVGLIISANETKWIGGDYEIGRSARVSVRVCVCLGACVHVFEALCLAEICTLTSIF